MLQTSDWVLVFTTLFLGFVAIFGDRIKNHILGPRLHITYDHAPPYSHKTFFGGEFPVYYFRFVVENTGHAIVQSCEAILENIWIYDEAGIPRKITTYDTHLRYDKPQNPRADINPERKIYWNIGHISSQGYQENKEKNDFIDLPGADKEGLRFILEFTTQPYAQPNNFPPGKYLIQVGVYSENAGHKTIYFEIHWSGKWRDNERDMFKQIVIRKVDRLPNL